MEVYRAAVIGLGNIGLLLSQDQKRKQTWSHCDAYKKWKRTRLSGAVDIDPEKGCIFREMYPDVPLYQKVEELFTNKDIDVVSICTPTKTHLSVLIKILEYPVKAVFCEKPMTATTIESRTFLDAVKQKGIIVALNYVRRWNGCFLKATSLIARGEIGEVRTINAFYPGQVYNIGSHLFDTIRMLIRKNPIWVRGIFSDKAKSQDPSVSGLICFEGDVICTVSATGRREDLIFEIDVIGDEGRLQIFSNGNEIRFYRFLESDNYSGYRELKEQRTEEISLSDPLLSALKDITDVLDGRKSHPECTAIDGFWSLALAEAMVESAKRKGAYRSINPPS